MAGIYQAAWRTVSCLILHLSFHCKQDCYYHSTSQKEPDFTVSRLSFKLRQRLSVKFDAYGQHIFQITSSWNPQSYQPGVYCIWVLPTSCKDAAITLDVAWREVRGTHSPKEPPCKLRPLPDWCLTTSGQNLSSLPMAPCPCWQRPPSSPGMLLSYSHDIVLFLNMPEHFVMNPNLFFFYLLR